MSESSVKNAASFWKPALIILVVMLALGCSKAGPEVVGVWDNVKAPESVEFKTDGTGMFTYPNRQTPPLSFSWKNTVKNSCTLEVNFNGTSKTLTATVKDKSLEIESTMGKELYQRHTSR